MLQLKHGQIIDNQGNKTQLRGTCIGGWMNMENFINGYPGAEHTLRSVMADTIGKDKAQFFFDRLLDHFLTEDDLAFIKSCGANVVRIPLNYRHFEADTAPFTYLEAGFERLNKAIQWCSNHQLYVILDLHAVQGWQNTDWHSDNNHRQTFFWSYPHYQDRFVALWEEFARRYKGNATVAGYNVMNEPLTYAQFGRFSDVPNPNWEVMNQVYRRVVNAIRALDPDHIIFLEGDRFSALFSGLDAPFAENLIYSSHNYTPAGFGPGQYPGNFNGQYWDKAFQEKVFLESEGTVFTRQHHVPLWVGEFGSVYNGKTDEVEDRLQAVHDQITVFQENDAHWTTWTYKDVGVMGWVMLDPDSAYMKLMKDILAAKIELDTDFWMGWLPFTTTKGMIETLARHIESTLNDPKIDPKSNKRYLTQHTLEGYVGGLMQYTYARLFEGMPEEKIDQTLESFQVNQCRPNTNLTNLLRTCMSQ
jgi:endoglucanase